MESKLSRCVIGLLLLGTSLIYAGEKESISAAVKRNVPDEALRPSFERLLTAIRKAENGRPGLEFGIMNPSCNTFDLQAGWCAQKCYAEYRYWRLFEREQTDFIDYLATQYAPVGVANDPNNLNRHWARNVKKIMEQLNKEDK